MNDGLAHERLNGALELINRWGDPYARRWGTDRFAVQRLRYGSRGDRRYARHCISCPGAWTDARSLHWPRLSGTGRAHPDGRSAAAAGCNNLDL